MCFDAIDMKLRMLGVILIGRRRGDSPRRVLSDEKVSGLIKLGYIDAMRVVREYGFAN